MLDRFIQGSGVQHRMGHTVDEPRLISPQKVEQAEEECNDEVQHPKEKMQSELQQDNEDQEYEPLEGTSKWSDPPKDDGNEVVPTIFPSTPTPGVPFEAEETSYSQQGIEFSEHKKQIQEKLKKIFEQRLIT